MVKYRFVKFEHSKKWYALARGMFTEQRQRASLFTEVDWLQWGEAAGLIKEPLGEDQLMRLAGESVAPPLPGFEL